VQPGIGVVGSRVHLDLARRIAEASVTLVRDPGRLLPLVAGPGSRVAVVAPRPADLTPAETSSYVKVELGAALRDHGLSVEEHVIQLDPSSDEIAALANAVDVVVVATFESVHFPSQAALVRRLAERRPTIAIALRSPYDVATYPAAATAICTYGIQPPQIEAVADALVGSHPVRRPLACRAASARRFGSMTMRSELGESPAVVERLLAEGAGGGRRGRRRDAGAAGRRGGRGRPRDLRPRRDLRPVHPRGSQWAARRPSRTVAVLAVRRATPSRQCRRHRHLAVRSVAGRRVRARAVAGRGRAHRR